MNATLIDAMESPHKDSASQHACYPDIFNKCKEMPSTLGKLILERN